MNKQIPRNIVSILLLFIVLLFSAGTSNAQHYPVQCNVQLIPPYSVHLADYYQGSNQKLLVNLTLKDLNHADLSVRLRISIEGQGIKLITKDDFIPKAPVLLQAGTPELLYGDRLEEYLAPEHMNFSGITQKQFLKTGRLPEGVYKFTVEVFEARRQEKVSNTATSMAWMLLNEPPVITAPANNKLLKATDPASIFFNWLPRHMNSQNALADVEYEFTMVEIWPVNQSAEEAIRSKEPLLKTVFRNTSFVYDAQYPMLVPGRQYACRVRAFSSQQKEMFKNEGYSPVVSFVFGEECKPPLMVDVDPALGGSAQLSIVPQSNHSSFTVQIRDVAGEKWYSQQSNQPDFELKQLKPGAAYQYKVQAQCETLESEFTPISQFSLSKEQAEVECGQSAAIPEIDGSPALNQLTAGDVINAGGFKVTVKQASGSRGTFTGSGVVRIGMLGNIELRTIFDNIKVNESYQLTAGEIRVVGSDIYALGSDIRDQADDFFNNDIWDSVDDAIADAESIVDEISNLQTDMGDNSLNNELEKAKRTIEKGRDKLAVGNKEGAQLVKEGADKVAQILDQVNSGDFQITANGIFFFAHSSQSYGFDSHDEGLTEEEKKAYLPYYQSLQLGDTTKQYYLKAWKSIGSNGNDVVNVKMQLSNGMKADTVHFMNAMGAEITPQKQGDAFSLNLRGSFHEDVQQITAYYNVKDDSTKNTKKVLLGALNVISYDQIEKNLVLVPVNGNSTSIPRAQLETYLNDTYSPANVRWTVSRHAGVQVEYSDDMSQGLDDGESKMLSNYTKEMNKVIKALKRSGDYDKHKTYVFLVDKAQTANKAGFMPKKRPWGFVFTNIHYNNSKALCRTIAHEVAHGEFRLSHPFQDFPSIPENSTQNLMDYADGQQLRKYQWDDIHNLRDVELWGQEEEGNASMSECTVAKLKEYFTLTQSESMTMLESRKEIYNSVYTNFDDLMEKLEVNAKAEKKEEVENIEGWSLRGSTLDENAKGFLYERILKKLEESENDKEVEFNLIERGIYLGKAKIGEENYNLAIYCDKEKSVIKKAQLKDYCELIDNEELNKQIKVTEIGDYLLLAFFKDEKVEMVVQFMSDDDDEFKKLLTAFKVLKGEEKFDGNQVKGIMELYHNDNLITQDSSLYLYISEMPEMPKNIKIKNVGKINAKFDVNVKYLIKYKYSNDVYEFLDEKKIASFKNVSPQEEVHLKFDEFIGGTVEITCVCENDIEKRTFHIRGKNPTKSQIKSYLNNKGYSNYWFLNKIIQHESLSMQFDHYKVESLSLAPIDEKAVYVSPFKNGKGQKGLPLYGGPKGFGLKQLDNWRSNGVDKVCSAEQRWNWKANVDGGLDVVGTKVKSVINNLQDELLLIKEWLGKYPESYAVLDDIVFGKITFTNSKSPIFPNLNVINTNAPSGKYSFLDAILIGKFNGGVTLFKLNEGKEDPNPLDEEKPILHPPHWEVVETYKRKEVVISNTSYINEVCNN